MSNITGKPENVNRIDGVVEAIEIKTKKYALMIKQHKYWGDLPAKYKNDELIKVGHHVVLDWKEVRLENGNIILRSILGMVEKIDIQPTNTTSTKGDYSPTPFKPASIDHVQDIVSEGAKIQAACFDAVTDILGRKPESDGDKALVSSLFIYATKELYFRQKNNDYPT
jgi:hypothetical protein